MENNKEKTSIENEYIMKGLKIAVDDFETFCKYAGVNLMQLKICIERNKGLTFGQISIKLDIPKTTVKNTCDRCFDNTPKKKISSNQ